MRRKKLWRFYLLAGLTLILTSLVAACGTANPTANTTPNIIVVTATPATTNAPGAATTVPAAPTTSAALPTVTSASRPTTAASVPAGAATTQPATTTAPVATTTQPQPTTGTAYPGKIVFDNDKREVYIINPDGTDPRKLAEGTTPLLSPDGKRVAFVTGLSKDYMPPFRAVIQMMNLDGSNKTELCTTDKPNYLIQLVRWSPRDRFIAFGSLPTQVDGWPLISLCNTTDKKQVTAVKPRQGDAAVVYDWSPDGNYTLWQSYTDNIFNLYYGDPDKAGTDATLLLKGEPQPPGIPSPDFSSARFSPDGKTIAVALPDKVLLISTPGQKSPLEGKTYSFEHPYRLSWSPDSRALAVISIGSTTGKGSLIVFDIASGKQTKLAEDVGLSVDWSRQ